MLKFLKFVPVQLTFFLIVGILFGYYFTLQLEVVITILILFVGIGFLVFFLGKTTYKFWILFNSCVYVCFVFIGILTVTIQNQKNWKNYYSYSNGFLLNKPIIAKAHILKELKPTTNYTKYEAQIVQVNGNSTKGNVLLLIEKDSLFNNVNVGNTLLISGEFDSISQLNAFGFNYKRYLQNKQIYYQVSVKKNQAKLLDTNSYSLSSFAANLRTKITETLRKEGFKADVLGVINALILGQRTEISTDLMESYANAGAIHILAVSGLHVGIILLLLLFIFKPLQTFKYGKLVVAIFVIILLWAYAILAGLSPSVVRAVAMFTAVTIGLQLNKPSNVYNTLVISMFFLLLFNPFYLFEIGFQLSYLAVFFIVWLQPMFYNLWQPKIWLFKKIWQLIMVSLTAQIGILPLSLYYFHQFPGLFLITNLLLVPILGIILVVGIAIILFSLVQIEPNFLTAGYIFTIERMNAFVNWIAAQDIFIFREISFSFSLVLISFVVIISFFKFVEKKTYKGLVVLFCSVILLQSVVLFEKYENQTQHRLIVFNAYKNSLVGIKEGKNFHIHTSIQSGEEIHKKVNSFLVSKNIQILKIDTILPNVFSFKNKLVLTIDSNGIYKIPQLKPDIVLLINSPKINLNRMLTSLKPKLVIADGSNYTSFITIWKKSTSLTYCKFFSTSQQGDFVLN